MSERWLDVCRKGETLGTDNQFQVVDGDETHEAIWRLLQNGINTSLSLTKKADGSVYVYTIHVPEETSVSIG